MMAMMCKLGRKDNLRRLALLLVLILFAASFSALPSHIARPEPPRDPARPTALARPSGSSNEHYFEQQVRPIFQAHCIRCHGPERHRGGLRLDSLGALLKGGDSGPAIVPHHPEQSLLIGAIAHQDLLHMPPSGKLGDDQIKTVTAWVAMGAPWPKSSQAGDGAAWAAVTGASLWSLQPVKKAAVPEVIDRSWPLSPIDAFVLAKLEEKQLAPAPPADRLTLIRRATFDLTGLPPTPQEIKDFVADDRPDAFAKVVDRLLASPRYGEHWARHWLDLACYAETNNHRIKPNSFRYRDYVIDAFNEDVPYRQFVIEQLAGDLMPDARRNSRGQNASAIGVGFLWMREIPVRQCDTFDAEAARADHVADQIDQIGKTFLGLTLGCARCHVHKFDPISQEDYYALAGFLRSTQMIQANVAPGKRAADAIPIWKAAGAAQRAIAVLRARNGQARKMLERIDVYLLAVAALRGEDARPTSEDRIRALAKERGLDPDQLVRWYNHLTRPGMAFDPLFGPWVRMMAAPADRFRGRLNEVIQDGTGNLYHCVIRAALIDPEVDSLPALAKKYNTAILKAYDAWIDGTEFSENQELLVASLLRPNSPLKFACKDEQLSANDLETVRELRRRCIGLIDEIHCFALTAVDGVPEDARLHIRGNSKTPGPVVRRAFVASISTDRQPMTFQGSGRLYLAHQIAVADNPLTARVFVNRVWQHHFGAGLVRTSDNFGHVGEAPTHPELLDYLAHQFVSPAGSVENHNGCGWSIKALHRQMMLTRTYQMSSVASAQALQADPENRLLQRMPVRRLAAEEIRDSMLAAAGMLDNRLYGPGIPSVKMGGAVDGERRRSIYLYLDRDAVMPMLLAFDFPNPNLPFGRRHVSIVPAQAMVLMNSEFAHHVARVWGAQMAASDQAPSARVEAMFWSALGRSPTAEELAGALDFLREQGDHQAQLGASADPAGAWADLAHCLLNTNAFLFVR